MSSKFVKSIAALGLVLVSAVKAQAQGWQRFIPGNLQSAGGGRLESYIQLIINAALLLAGVVAVVYLIIGGYQYITSSGNAEQAQTGRTTVMNAIIGLIIIFAAFVIVRFIMQRIAPTI